MSVCLTFYRPFILTCQFVCFTVYLSVERLRLGLSIRLLSFHGLSPLSSFHLVLAVSLTLHSSDETFLQSSASFLLFGFRRWQRSVTAFGGGVWWLGSMAGLMVVLNGDAQWRRSVAEFDCGEIVFSLFFLKSDARCWRNPVFCLCGGKQCENKAK